MLKYKLLSLLLFTGFVAYSSDLTDKAEQAYLNDNFAEAAQLYNEIIKTEGNSPLIQYNLGNCYYRMGEFGKSIIAYERALRLDPSFKDAKYNLELVNKKIIDVPGEKGSFMSNTYERIANKTHSNVWGWISLALFIFLIICMGSYFFSANILLKKLGFFVGIGLLFLVIGGLILAFKAKQIATNPNIAIIISPEVTLSTVPRAPKDQSEKAIILHEGTKVEILDSVSSYTDSLNIKWYDVQIDNDHRAWIKSTDIEHI